jgi:hypothetical protein
MNLTQALRMAGMLFSPINMLILCGSRKISLIKAIQGTVLFFLMILPYVGRNLTSGVIFANLVFIAGLSPVLRDAGAGFLRKYRNSFEFNLINSLPFICHVVVFSYILIFTGEKDFPIVNFTDSSGQESVPLPLYVMHILILFLIYLYMIWVNKGLRS